MKSTIRRYEHPRNPNEIVYGRQLEVGDVIQREDVYDHSDGHWVRGHTEGIALTSNCAAFWVRPAVR